jgi:hypothetical protein
MTMSHIFRDENGLLLDIKYKCTSIAEDDSLTSARKAQMQLLAA